MTDEKYEGFSNYITWVVYHCLRATEQYYNELLDFYKAFYLEDPAEFSLPELIFDFITNRKYELFDAIPLPKEHPNLLMFFNIINTALSDVNYEEIADRLFKGSTTDVKMP